LASTWSQAAPETPTTVASNAYRKFKVTGHVTNQFNKEFAKLDAFPEDDKDTSGNVVTATTASNVRPDYNLKITHNNGTVREYVTATGGGERSNAFKVTVNEVQKIVIGDGGTDAASNEVWKLMYGSEISEDLTHASTAAQIAEEINGFSALSGPVVVETDMFGFKVTFDAKDGDVAEMTVADASGTKSVNVVTQENGWSIEAPVYKNGFSSMEAGGIVNITAAETCTFTAAGTITDADFLFCYNGVCGSSALAAAGNAAAVKTAVQSILDDNGDAVLTVEGTGTTAPAFVVVMPLGFSCDGLEMIVADLQDTTGITKSVNKNNNGKSFRITRSFTKSLNVAPAGSESVNHIPFTPEFGFHAALAGVDSLVINTLSGGAGACDHQVATSIDTDQMPIMRTIPAINYAAQSVGEAAVAKTVMGTSSISATGELTGTSSAGFARGQIVKTSECTTAANNGNFLVSSIPGGTKIQLVNLDGSGLSGLTADTDCKVEVVAAGLAVTTGTEAKCAYNIARHVITLDAMPDASTTATAKTVRYTSPVGSCSVAETVKGTQESYECSNRGACDTGSGICGCYEGYSGQSCQTQTVLV